MYVLQLVTENNRFKTWNQVSKLANRSFKGVIRCGLMGNFMEEIIIEAKKYNLEERGEEINNWEKGNGISKEDKRKKYEVDENSDLICLKRFKMSSKREFILNQREAMLNKK